MASEGQVLQGPGGMVLRLETIGEEALVMEASYSGEGGMPPEHLHPRQTERFTVLEGAMRTIIGGEERRYAAGDSFEVPPGTVHQMGAEGPTRTRWEVRPPLRTAEFFERLYGGTAGPGFLEEFAEEFRLV